MRHAHHIKPGPENATPMSCPSCASQRLVAQVLLIEYQPAEGERPAWQSVTMGGTCSHCGEVLARVEGPILSLQRLGTQPRRTAVAYDGQPPARNASTGCGYAPRILT